MYLINDDGTVVFIPPKGATERVTLDEFALLTVSLAKRLDVLPVIEKALDLQACFLSRSLSSEELNTWLYRRGVDLLASLPVCSDVRAHVLPDGGICEEYDRANGSVPVGSIL